MIRTVTTLAMLTVLSFPRPLTAQRQELTIVNDLPSLSRNKIVDECSPSAFVSGRVKWQDTYPDKNHPAWLRPELVVQNAPPTATWHILVLDERGSQVDDLASTRFVAGNPVWSRVVNGSEVSVKIISDDRLDGATFCIHSINEQKDLPPQVTSVIDGNDDRRDLVLEWGTDNPFYEYGHSVVLVRFQDVINGHGVESNCTGVLVARTLVATNNHCIGSDQQVSTATVTFNYETDSDTVAETPVQALVATNEALDYSLLQIQASSVPLARISLRDVRPKQKMILIQHPLALPKQIAVKKCMIQQVRAKGRKSDFFHLCDSSGGSSGSPMMDEETGIVYGLHHIGVTDVKRKDYHNLAVYFSEIMADLKNSHSDLYSEISTQLVDQPPARSQLLPQGSGTKQP